MFSDQKFTAQDTHVRNQHQILSIVDNLEYSNGFFKMNVLRFPRYSKFNADSEYLN